MLKTTVKIIPLKFLLHSVSFFLLQLRLNIQVNNDNQLLTFTVNYLVSQVVHLIFSPKLMNIYLYNSYCITIGMIVFCKFYVVNIAQNKGCRPYMLTSPTIFGQISNGIFKNCSKYVGKNGKQKNWCFSATERFCQFFLCI